MSNQYKYNKELSMLEKLPMTLLKRGESKTPGKYCIHSHLLLKSLFLFYLSLSFLLFCLPLFFLLPPLPLLLKSLGLCLLPLSLLRPPTGQLFSPSPEATYTFASRLKFRFSSFYSQYCGSVYFTQIGQKTKPTLQIKCCLHCLTFLLHYSAFYPSPAL